jgi:hypothetical protein
LNSVSRHKKSRTIGNAFKRYSVLFVSVPGDECLSQVREHMLDSWRQELDVEANP